MSLTSGCNCDLPYVASRLTTLTARCIWSKKALTNRVLAPFPSLSKFGKEIFATLISSILVYNSFHLEYQECSPFLCILECLHFCIHFPLCFQLCNPLRCCLHDCLPNSFLLFSNFWCCFLCQSILFCSSFIFNFLVTQIHSYPSKMVH